MVNEVTEHDSALISNLLVVLENSVPDLSNRMTVRMLRMIIESSRAEMEKAGEEDACFRAILVFREMEKNVRVLAAANTGSSAGRLCSTILDGMCAVDIQDMWQCLEEGNVGGVIQLFLTMYAALGAKLAALTEDDNFITSMGPDGRRALLGLESAFGVLIEAGHRAIQELSTTRSSA